MTTFKDQMAIDLDNVFFNTDEFAVEVIYTPQSGGPGQTIKAIVDYDVDQNSQGIKSDGYEHILTCERNIRSVFGTGIIRNVATVTVKITDVPEPRYRDKIEIDGVEFLVAEIFDHA